MTDWSEELTFLLKKFGKTAGSAARAVKSVLDDDPYELLCYRGFGSSTHAWIHGRVVEKRDIGAATDGDSTLRNLLNTYRRADSDPLPSAGVAIKSGDAVLPLSSDDEGYFGGMVELPLTDSDDEWREYSVEIVSPPNPSGDPVKGSGEILTPSKTARFGVISDIDDTVIQSRVSSFLQAARTVMLGNARTRLPFPGVAAFYRALRDGAASDEKNPVFYVSSSPWNIYDVIAEFMELQNIPKGPIVLRDWDMDFGAFAGSRHFDHKGVAIRNILGLYPSLPFILIGDSSQHDPEIYRQIVSEFPGRIRAIYIRDVIRSPERSSSITRLANEILEAKSVLVLSDDTLGAAKHAVEQGWISEKTLPEIGEEKRADEGTDGSKVPAPEGGKPGTTAPPTVVGESPPAA